MKGGKLSTLRIIRYSSMPIGPLSGSDTAAMNLSLVNLSLAAVVAATCLSSASAQSVLSLVASKDATLNQSTSGNVANGAGTRLFVGRVAATGSYGRRRALIKWDIAGSIPAGSRILAVKLDLWVDISSAFLPQNTLAHRVLQDWSEGTVAPPRGGGMGAPATAGSTTWLHTNYPSQFWNNAGGDFAATSSFTFDMPNTGAILTEPLAGLIADVQDMLDNPASNYGWLFKTPEVQTTTARAMLTREALGLRPKLHITYLTPGQTGVYGTGCPVGGGTLQLDVTGTATGGAVLPITYSNAPSSSIGANFFSLALDPIGTPLFANCSAYLPLAGTIISGDAFVVVGGVGSTNFTVPVGFPGFLINVQAAVLDTTPLSFSLSNSGVMLTQ